MIQSIEMTGEKKSDFNPNVRQIFMVHDGLVRGEFSYSYMDMSTSTRELDVFMKLHRLPNGYRSY